MEDKELNPGSTGNEELTPQPPIDPQSIIKEHYQSVGRAGGNATVAKHGREHMRELGRKSGEKRRLKKQNNGEANLGGATE